MKKLLILYDSSTGHTEKMARFVEKGVTMTAVEVETKNVTEATVDDLLTADGIILGSPTYFGVMAAELKEFVDKSIKHFGKLGGKVGGAFATSGGIGGGNETTIISIIEALLIHGMIIQGTTKGGHYGPVSIGAPDKRVEQECIALGERLGNLVKRLF